MARVRGGLELFFLAVVLETWIFVIEFGAVKESMFANFISVLGAGVSFGGKFLIVYNRLARM